MKFKPMVGQRIEGIEPMPVSQPSYAEIAV
jgi:hypothetical protein